MSSSDDSERPEPVDGTTFDPSTVLALVCILIGSLLAVASGVLLTGLLTRQIPPSLKAIIGGAAAGPGGALFAGFGVRMFIRKKRFVVGEDRFQFVERIGGEDVVIAQVMFANETGLAMNRVGNVKVVCVRLADPKAEGTYDAARYIPIVKQRQDRRGYEVCVPDEFRGGLGDLLETLDAAVIAWRTEQEDD